MITAAEARNRVNKEITEAAAKQLQEVEKAIDRAIKNKYTTATVTGSLLPPVKTTLLGLGYSVHEREENDRQVFTVTDITF